jgi:hypothetical protein
MSSLDKNPRSWDDWSIVLPLDKFVLTFVDFSQVCLSLDLLSEGLLRRGSLCLRLRQPRDDRLQPCSQDISILESMMFNFYFLRHFHSGKQRTVFGRRHDTQHNWLSYDIQHNSFECHYAECRNFYYYYAECRYA